MFYLTSKFLFFTYIDVNVMKIAYICGSNEQSNQTFEHVISVSKFLFQFDSLSIRFFAQWYISFLILVYFFFFCCLVWFDLVLVIVLLLQLNLTQKPNWHNTGQCIWSFGVHITILIDNDISNWNFFFLNKDSKISMSWLEW